MEQQDLDRLRANSDAVQSALGKPPKLNPNGQRSAYYNPSNGWWLEGDIRPEAIYLKIHTLTAAQATALIAFLRSSPAFSSPQPEQPHA